MSPLTALLCLGLSVSVRTSVQTGTLPRPTLWAEPGSVVPLSSSVTLWCQGIPGAQDFRLLGETRVSRLDEPMSLGPQNKATFSISFMTGSNTGTYRCQYQSRGAQSEPSDPLELVVTGYHSKPSLSALPSPVVTSGGTVTLSCDSDNGFNGFILTQEGESGVPQILESQTNHRGQRQALFSVGPVTPGHSWTFRCYGYYSYNPLEWSPPSDPLQLRISAPSGVTRPPPLAPRPTVGTLPRPTLWAEPGSVVPRSSSVTLWCQGIPGAQDFRLLGKTRVSRLDEPMSLGPQNKATFYISDVTGFNSGSYRCQYQSGGAPSEPSDPLELVVTGYHSKPSLSALPSPVVTSGGTVTLSCDSKGGFDGFVLTQEGKPVTPRTQGSQTRPRRQHQALFSVGPVTPGHSWTFRCYGYDLFDPHQWSFPSDPLQLRISAPSGVTRPPPPVPRPTVGVLPKPTLWAEPGSVIPWGHPVTLWCQGAPGAQDFRLLGETSASSLDERMSLGPQNKATFSFSDMTTFDTGTYRCQYQSRGVQSEPSDPLELLVTGPSGVTTLQDHLGSHPELKSTMGAATTTSPSQTNTDSSTAPDSRPRDYTVENLLRLGAAGFLLLVLGILLLEAWHSPRKS